MNAMIPSAQLSRAFSDATDDSREDVEHAGWLGALAEDVRDEWIATLKLARGAAHIVDAAGDDDGAQWRSFTREWLRVKRRMEPSDGVFRDSFDYVVLSPAACLDAWDAHFRALWRHRHPLNRTIDDYECALLELSGTRFLAMPFRRDDVDDAVAAFGALDQLYDNVRDFAADVRRGVVHLPLELLARHDLAVAELPCLLDRSDARVEAAFLELFATFLPYLEARAAPLVELASLSAPPALHPSWIAMVRHMRARHARIEMTARRCRFNPAAFEDDYWGAVEHRR